MPAPVRSRAVLDGARGQPCTLRLAPDCDGGGISGTTVSCHITDQHKGFGRKASDLSIAFGCAACHRWLDQGPGAGKRDAETAWALIRAMQETLALLHAAGIVKVPEDKPPAPKPAKPRLPQAQRAKIGPSAKLRSGPSNWAKGRKIPSRAKPA